MVSEAQIAANRRNAMKSCGPKTESGRNIARMNALKHGLTASIAMLPEEDGAEYEAQRADFFEKYKPRNGLEVVQVERSFYLWWQLGRIGRAQSAQLCANARTADGEIKEREARETIELTHQLLKPGREARWGGSKISNSKTAGEAQGGDGSREKGIQHPAIIGIRLEFLGDGCRWLYRQWNELSAPLDEGRAWQAVECFKAARLLGMQPESVINIGQLAEFLRPCVALAGGRIELAKETWALLAPPDAEDGWELMRAQLELVGFGPDSAESARHELRSIVQKQIDRVAQRLEGHDEVAEIQEALGPHLHAFDSSPKGERIRRYERDCQRGIDRIERELKNRPGRSAEQFGPAYSAYRKLNPSMMKRTLAAQMAIDGGGDSSTGHEDLRPTKRSRCARRRGSHDGNGGGSAPTKRSQRAWRRGFHAPNGRRDARTKRSQRARRRGCHDGAGRGHAGTKRSQRARRRDSPGG